MCGCENHWDSAASCTCNCPEHYGRKIAPEPPEPNGDGALVACDYDGKQGRAVLLGGAWTFYGESLRDHGAIYDDFVNVRVLSEGVTA